MCMWYPYGINGKEALTGDLSRDLHLAKNRTLIFKQIKKQLSLHSFDILLQRKNLIK